MVVVYVVSLSCDRDMRDNIPKYNIWTIMCWTEWGTLLQLWGKHVTDDYRGVFPSLTSVITCMNRNTSYIVTESIEKRCWFVGRRLSWVRRAL